MSPRLVKSGGWLVVGCLAVAIWLFAHSSTYWLGVLTLALLIGTVAQSWNLMAGWAGQWSIAQMAFFGLGAYTSGIGLQRWGIPLFAGLFIGGFVAAAAAGIVGVISLRLRGHYFSLVTFMLIFALGPLFLYFTSVTGGGNGLATPVGLTNDIWKLQFASDEGYFLLSLAVAIFATAVVFLISRSRMGLLLRTIRADEDAARTVGIRTLRLKVITFMVAGFLAGLAGTAYLATYNLIDTTTAFGFSEALEPVIGGILGGPGFLFGGIVGELILQPLESEVNTLFGASTFGAESLVYGVCLMFVVLVIPEGILSRLDRVRKRVLARTAGAAAPPAADSVTGYDHLAATATADAVGPE